MAKLKLLKHCILSNSLVIRWKIRGTKKPQIVTRAVCGQNMDAEGWAAQGSECRMLTPRLLGTGSGEARGQEDSPDSFHILGARKGGLVEASALFEGSSVACSGSITAPRQLGVGVGQHTGEKQSARSRPAQYRVTGKQPTNPDKHSSEYGCLSTVIWMWRRQSQGCKRERLDQRSK